MRIFKYVLFISAILIICTIGGYTLFKQEFTSSGQISKAAKQVSKIEKQEEVKVAEEKKNKVDVGMTEIQLQQYLHEMTHSKVVADKKWGATPITTENINNLIAIVEANNFEHEEFYLKHLNEWKNGSFRGAVEVHNRIWSWHGGTIGPATGLMSDAAEQMFIEKNFGQ